MVCNNDCKNCYRYINAINVINKKADDMDLTYFIDSDGKYCVCDIDWIGRFDTICNLLDYLGIEIK